MRVIMLGPPGAGKGTQGERIASRYGVPHIASGNLFREEVTSTRATWSPTTWC
jgi:adenylate kinase